MQIGLFTAAPGITIPSSVTIVTTTGHHTIGKGIARYRRRSTAPFDWTTPTSPIPRWWFRSADGDYWALNEAKPDLLQFGGYDDATRDETTFVVSGTDNTEILNELLFYCQMFDTPNAYVPAGNYKFDDVIHLGYGDGTFYFNDVDAGPHARYSHVNLIGTAPLLSGGAGNLTFNGTAFYSTKSDRPLINIQGQRNCEIRGILFAGLFKKFCTDNNLAVISNPTSETEQNINNRPMVDDRDIDTWHDPALSANQDTQFTPYAAVTIDAYSGNRPAVSYPDAVYPAYTAITEQWNKGQSSEINIVDCNLEGFIAAVAVQPCNYDGNGDFLRLYRCNITYCKYGITIGNDQSRNVALHDCNPVYVHTLLEGMTHGLKTGRFQGPIVNMSGGEMMQLVNMSGTIGAPISFYDCYVEGLDRIGNLYGSASGGLAFIGGSLVLSLDSYHNLRGTPPNHFNGSNQRYKGAEYSDASLRFVNTTLQYRGALVLLSTDVSIKGGMTSDFEIDTRDPILNPVLPYEALATNALAGGIVTPYFGGRPEQAKADISSHFRVRNVSTGDTGGYKAIADSVWGDATRDYGSPAYAAFLQAFPLTDPVLVGRSNAQLPKAAWFTGSSLTLSYDATLGKLVLQGTLAAFVVAESTFALPGDVLTDDDTGVTFRVFSYNATTRVMRAVLINGYKGVGTAMTTTVPFSTSAGSLQSTTARRYTPGFAVFVTSQASKAFSGTTATGSATVTGVTSGSGSSLNVVDASAVLVGLRVSGAGIPADTYCIGVSGTTVQLSAPATAAGTVTLTFGVASPTLTNVGHVRGFADAAPQIAAGDYIGSDGFVEYLAPFETTITAVDNATATLTLSSNAVWPPVTNRRLRSLRMAAPANV